MARGKQAPDGSLAVYRTWSNRLRDDRTDLGTYTVGKDAKKKDKKLTRLMFYAVCTAIASRGLNGFYCGVSDQRVAEDLGMSRNTRGTIREHRKRAIELGWFVETGGNRGRVKELNISLPGRVSVPTPTPTEDDPWEVAAVPSPRPTQTLSASSRASSAPVAKHVGTADPNGADNCSACAPSLARWRAGGFDSEQFDEIMLTHAKAVI